MPPNPDRREVLALASALIGASAWPRSVFAKANDFSAWVEAFRPRALAAGVSAATYTQVMTNVRPDTSVYPLLREQPEFHEPLWKYVNRRVSAWRIETGRERERVYGALLERIEADYKVDRFTMLGLWGMESAFGEVVTDRKYMRPVIPALAALAWGEP